MRFTARPRVGGRRAVGRWRRGGPHHALIMPDPLWGAGPAHPLRGRAVTRLGSLGRAGCSWDGRRWGEGVVRGHCRLSSSLIARVRAARGGELEFVERCA